MKYLVQPIVGDLPLDTRNMGVITNGGDRCNNKCHGYCPGYCPTYEICYTPTGPKMAPAGIKPKA